ncbi:hypothetical protein K523DRAFT_326185, partial [Schizophyllum commune Tattone D]
MRLRRRPSDIDSIGGARLRLRSRSHPRRRTSSGTHIWTLIRRWFPSAAGSKCRVCI